MRCRLPAEAMPKVEKAVLAVLAGNSTGARLRVAGFFAAAAVAPARVEDLDLGLVLM